MTGVRAAKGDLVLDLAGADVVSRDRDRRPLGEPAAAAALRTVQRAFDATVVRPLTSGRAGDVSTFFTADAAARATGPDRGSVFDEGFRPVKLVGTKTDVLLTGLDGGDGRVALLVAKVDWDVRAADRSLRVRRVGELTLVPAFGTWVVSAYTLLVNRTGGAS